LREASRLGIRNCEHEDGQFAPCVSLAFDSSPAQKGKLT
jgi:hypothetical protein